MSRFTEFNAKEKSLTPIVGYCDYPLVPLNQALKPLLSEINGLQHSIEEAYNHCRHPSEHNLTRDEAAALLLYTMEAGEYSFYRYLNKTLRDEDRRKVVPWFYFLNLLDSALNKLPVVRGCVWRGVPHDVSQQYQENEQLTWWSINSCSSSVKVVEKFLKPDSHSTLFMIEAIGGRDVSAYTMFPKEKEVILKMGTRLRVKDNAMKYGQLRVIHLEEVDRKGHHESATAAMGAMSLSPRPAGKSIRDLVSSLSWVAIDEQNRRLIEKDSKETTGFSLHARRDFPQSASVSLGNFKSDMRCRSSFPL